MSKTKTALIALTALLVATAGIAAAAPTADTETTDTSTTSDVVDGTTITGFSANSSNYTWVEASGMTSDGAVKLVDPDTGVVYYSNTSLEATNSSAGYYAANISNGALDNVPISAGANETYTMRLVNNTSADNPATTNLTVYLEGVEGRTVIYASPTALEDDEFGLKTDGIQLESIGVSVLEDKTASVSKEDVDVSGNNSTLTVHYANATAQSRLSESIGSLSSSSWDKSTIVKVEGKAVKAFVGSAPDDFNTSKTYAVIDSSANDVTIRLGDDLDDQKTVDVSTKLNAGWSDQFGAYGAKLFGVSMAL